MSNTTFIVAGSTIEVAVNTRQRQFEVGITRTGTDGSKAYTRASKPLPTREQAEELLANSLRSSFQATAMALAKQALEI